jgi:peptidyl-prolyl cis-trans isomerase D
MEIFRMFDFVRKHTKIMMFVMFLLIIPSFVLFGIDGYNRMSEKGVAVARVAGKEITQSEWDAAHKAEVDRMRESMPSIDLKMLDSAPIRYATLERLVRERVMAAAADQMHLAASDVRLARELQQDPTIASLRKPDGTLDMEQYRRLAASQGLTPEGFEERIRRDISIRQVEGGLLASGFAVSTISDQALNAFFEKRDVQLAFLKPAEFISKVAVNDADLESYYQANVGKFQAPERADVEFVVLDLEAVKKTITLNESDLKTYYEQNAARLSGNEERRASHILITAAKDAGDEARRQARAKADELLLNVRKAPDSFADLAKKNSQDPGSAKLGGDLDFFARGAMVKPFEDAVFALKKGEISAVVESDFGFHIIKLTDIKAPKQKSFDEMRAGLEAELRTQQATAKFAEAAEAFTNGVYEQSDTLKPVAERLKLDIKVAKGVGRTPDGKSSGVLTNPKLLSALFSADALEKKRNTEAVETGPSQLASARITAYQPAQTQAFADVRELVKERVVAERASVLARKEGEEKLRSWKAAPATAQLQAIATVSRDKPGELSADLLSAVMRADTSALPVWVGVDLGAQGYAIAKVNSVIKRAAPAELDAKQDRQRYSQWWSRAEAQSYYDALKNSVKADILVPGPTALTATNDGKASK